MGTLLRWALVGVALLAVGCSSSANEPDAGFDPDADIYPPDQRPGDDPIVDPCRPTDGGAGDGGAGDGGSFDGGDGGGVNQDGGPSPDGADGSTSSDGGTDPCNPDPVICGRGDCVFGDCVDVPGGQDRCACFDGYTGLLCDACAEGYVAYGLECRPAGACEADPCVHGTCRPGEGDAFTCDCSEGYAGALCDRCADGYHVEDLRCVPD